VRPKKTFVPGQIWRSDAVARTHSLQTLSARGSSGVIMRLSSTELIVLPSLSSPTTTTSAGGYPGRRHRDWQAALPSP